MQAAQTLGRAHALPPFEQCEVLGRRGELEIDQNFSRDGRAGLGAALHPALKVCRGVLTAEVHVAFSRALLLPERPLTRAIASVAAERVRMRRPVHASRSARAVRRRDSREYGFQIGEHAREVRLDVALADGDARLT